MNIDLLKQQTIKLVAPSDHKRALLFKQLLENRSVYKVLDTIDLEFDFNCDYNIIIAIETHTDLDKLILSINQQNKDKYTILDIQNSLFESKDFSAYLMAACVTAKFVTCSSPQLQELVYEYTGRLAAIIEPPIYPSQISKADTKRHVELPSKVNVVWYGDGQERFAVKPYLDANPNLKPVITVRVTDKEFEKLVLDWSDFIFLPKCYTDEDELKRLDKVEWCVQKGKLVVAPGLELDYEGMAQNFDLDQALVAFIETPEISNWIEESQKLLLKKYSPETSTDQLVFALKEAPKDEFINTLDYYLEQDV